MGMLMAGAAIKFLFTSQSMRGHSVRWCSDINNIIIMKLIVLITKHHVTGLYITWFTIILCFVSSSLLEKVGTTLGQRY